ncbi:conserved protein of unknown function [Tenacibaculum sp. 190130A14a]|uniref:Nucleotidyltransferase family protein n=1 Tax=Tenacibaculum polynesiense TaxID=3137857 RepID=A0ABM9P8E6_9FLAO
MEQDFSSELISIIKNDAWMLHILQIVNDLNLKDCWVGAGFIRNKVWDVKHNKPRTTLNDVDVIYFDSSNLSSEVDFQIEKTLKKKYPEVNWSVKNQARMHLYNNHTKYINCTDAISYWPETATAIAIQLNHNNQINVIAPYGLIDLFNLDVKPTPRVDFTIYNQRITNKNWKATWPNLTIHKE